MHALLGLAMLVLLSSCATSFEDAKRVMHHIAKCEYATYLKTEEGKIDPMAICFQTLRDIQPNYCAMRYVDLEDETYWTEVTQNYRIEGDCDRDKIITIVKRARVNDVIVNHTQRTNGRWHTIHDEHKVAMRFENMFTIGNQ